MFLTHVLLSLQHRALLTWQHACLQLWGLLPLQMPPQRPPMSSARRQLCPLQVLSPALLTLIPSCEITCTAEAP